MYISIRFRVDHDHLLIEAVLVASLRTSVQCGEGLSFELILVN